jgi:hypothetical protein
MNCTCPEFKLAPKGACEHILEVIEFHKRTSALPLKPAQAEIRAMPVTPDRPAVVKSEVARLLEHPFRPDQIKLKDDVPYVDGASVIQRLNDVLGTENWSFRILGEPVQVDNEVIIRGRLTATINGRQVVKEDAGAHEHTRKRNDRSVVSHGDTMKSAVTDCIKRCAHQLGVGLHLYSKHGSYQSFRHTPAGADRQTDTSEDRKEAI